MAGDGSGVEADGTRDSDGLGVGLEVGHEVGWQFVRDEGGGHRGFAGLGGVVVLGNPVYN